MLFIQIFCRMYKSRRHRVSSFSVSLGRVNGNQLTKMRMKTSEKLWAELANFSMVHPHKRIQRALGA
jgi:hypothetical protein